MARAGTYHRPESENTRIPNRKPVFEWSYSNSNPEASHDTQALRHALGQAPLLPVVHPGDGGFSLDVVQQTRKLLTITLAILIKVGLDHPHTAAVPYFADTLRFCGVLMWFLWVFQVLPLATAWRDAGIRGMQVRFGSGAASVRGRGGAADSATPEDVVAGAFLDSGGAPAFAGAVILVR